MQSDPSPRRNFTQSLLINFLAPVALIAAAVFIFLSLGTVQPPKRPEEDRSRSGRLRSLTPIRVEPIQAVDTQKTPLFLSVDGTVVPYEEANVAAEVSGRIVEKHERCQAGSSVRKGDLLMRIDAEDYLLEVQRLTQLKDQEYQRIQETDQQMLNSQRLIEVAIQDVGIQEKEIQRLKALPDGFASQTEIDQANRVLLAAKQQLVTLENQLALQKKQRIRIEASERLAATQLQVAEVNLRRTEIAAPIDGVIVNEQVDVNTFVARGSPLVTIENTSKVEVSTSLRMDQLYWILDQQEAQQNPGAKQNLSRSTYDLPQTEAIIEYEVAGRLGMVRQWKGTLKSYDGIGLDPKTRTVPIRVVVDDPSKFLHDGESGITASTATPLVRGMFVRIHLLIRPRTQLFVIPTKALQPGNRIYVFTADDSVLDLTGENSEDESAAGTVVANPDDANSFNANDWAAGKVRIRDEVIPVNSLVIGHSKLRSALGYAGLPIKNHSTNTGDDAAEGFWVCEVTGLEDEIGKFVVTSPLGSVSETVFPARAEKNIPDKIIEPKNQTQRLNPPPQLTEGISEQAQNTVDNVFDSLVKKGAQE